MADLTLACADEQQRRADILAHPELNGIDYLEVDPADHTRLHVFFLKPVPPADAADPTDSDDAWGLSADPSRVTISGGTRIVGVRALAVTRHADGHLEITASADGDFSTYTLELNVPDLAPVLDRIDFSFKASCPVDFDCRAVVPCIPEPPPEPVLDYMAKDYASFRRLMLDLIPQKNPSWTARNPSDLGIALVELFAYVGDDLSYFQDAVANEAYLETARQRISARRHARLVDYRMHNGRNAATWAHLTVNAAATLPTGTAFLTRIAAPLRGEDAPPGATVDAFLISADALTSDPALRGVLAFESTHPGAFDPRNNEIRIHTWGNEECCLAAGTREVFLFSVDPATGQASRPVLTEGEDLLVEEVRGPDTGLPADADPEHRQVVRIEGVPDDTEDPVYGDVLVDGSLQRRAAGDPALPLLRVRFRRRDALRFPVCLSKRRPDFELVRDVSVARGNLVQVDHGFTAEESIGRTSPVAGNRRFRLPLAHGPLTWHCQQGAVQYDEATGRVVTPRRDLDCDVREASPAVALFATFPTGDELWTAVPDLLESPPFARHFVAEVDNDGRATLRFGDGEYGREVAGATAFRAVYRIGNGRAGSVGREAVAHMVVDSPAGWLEAVRNPIAGEHAVDAESIEAVRRFAPQAFRAQQFRAVTEADYARVAEALPEVAGAVAAFRWTGSWYTVFVGVDPADEADLVQPAEGLMQLSPQLQRTVRAALERVRMTGYDLEVRPPTFVPLEIELDICVLPDHFRADVRAAVLDALSTRILPDGSRGFFHPDNFTFGDPLFLSRLYAAVERVEGVDSTVVRIFRRWGRPDDGELLAGVLPVGPWEIVLLQNDPSFMENGVLSVTARGGKA
jgi:hypothetical protein